MLRLVLSPLAQDDIDKIWDYTCDEWGVDQADAYTAEIREACRGLALGAKLGRPCKDVRKGYSRLISGSHIIFYRISASEIDIKRVLHQSMEFTRHL